MSLQAVTNSMDAAEPEVSVEEAAAADAEYDMFFAEVVEEIIWEELHDRHSAALTPTSSAVPAFQHHTKQGPLAQPVHPADINVQVHNIQEASPLTVHS